MFKTSTSRLVWMTVISSVFVNGQNCPNHCNDCKSENGNVIKATCSDVRNAEIPDTIQDLLMINGGQYSLPILRSYFFNNKDKLTILKIQSYHMRGLQGECFQGCPNLEVLDLSDNTLSIISPINFQGLTNLSYLSLNGNLLAQVGNSTFRNLAALEELHLAHNKLTTLDEDNFKGLDRLKKINLEFNEISSINKAFNGLTDLEEINLEGNQLNKLAAGMFNNLKNLRTLNLKANKIQQIDAVSLDGTLMTYLNLMQNQLSEIPTEFLQHISNISLEVSLAANNITDIAEGELHGIVLKTLIMVGNSMIYVHPDALCDSFIEKLDFQQNLLTHFPQGLQKNLNQSNTVLLGNNPWSCDCDIEWVKSLLRNTTQEPFCSEPLSYHGQALSQIINDLKVSCTDNPHLPVPTRNFPIPPRQMEVTPHLEQRTTKCSTTRNPKESKVQKSSEKGDKSYVAIILGVIFGLLLLIILIITIILIHKKKSHVAPELKMQCRKPDMNYRTQLHYLPKSSELIV